MIGLEHDRIASHESRQPVGDRHGQWIVPGSDDTDETLRHVVPIDTGQQRQDALAPFGAQIATCRPTVVTRGEGNVQHLLGGTQPVLADGLQQVNEVIAPIQKMIMKIEQQASSLVNGPSGPFRLCSVG